MARFVVSSFRRFVSLLFSYWILYSFFVQSAWDDYHYAQTVRFITMELVVFSVYTRIYYDCF